MLRFKIALNYTLNTQFIYAPVQHFYIFVWQNEKKEMMETEVR